MVSACFLVTSVATATRSINSAFVIAPLSSPRPAGDSVSTGASTLGDRVFRLLARPLLLRGGGLSFRFGRLCRRLDRSGLGNRLRLGRCGGGGGGGSLGASGLRSAARLQVRRGQPDLHFGIVDPKDAGPHRIPFLEVILRFFSAR